MGQELAKGLANTLRVLALIQMSVPSFPMADKVLDTILPDGQLQEAVLHAELVLDQAMLKLDKWQRRVEAEAAPSRLLEWSAQPAEGEGGSKKASRREGWKGTRRGAE